MPGLLGMLAPMISQALPGPIGGMAGGAVAGGAKGAFSGLTGIHLPHLGGGQSSSTGGFIPQMGAMQHQHQDTSGQFFPQKNQQQPNYLPTLTLPQPIPNYGLPTNQRLAQGGLYQWG